MVGAWRRAFCPMQQAQCRRRLLRWYYEPLWYEFYSDSVDRGFSLRGAWTCVYWWVFSETLLWVIDTVGGLGALSLGQPGLTSQSQKYEQTYLTDICIHEHTCICRLIPVSIYMFAYIHLCNRFCIYIRWVNTRSGVQQTLVTSKTYVLAALSVGYQVGEF